MQKLHARKSIASAGAAFNTVGAKLASRIDGAESNSPGKFSNEAKL